MAIGAATGYVTSAGAEAGVEWLEGNSIDQSRVNNAGLAGAAQGALIGAVNPAGKPAQAVLGAAAGVGSQVIQDHLNHEKTTAGGVVIAGVAGAAGGVAGPKLAARAASAARTQEMKAVVNAAAQGQQNAMVQLGGSLKTTVNQGSTAVRQGAASVASAVGDFFTSIWNNVQGRDHSNDKNRQRY